jgi:hypothetical protein
LICDRYVENAPTVGLIDISLSLTHDEHLRLALADVVERLERQAAHQRGVADDDRDPLEPWRRSRASARPSAIDRPVPA